MRIGSHYVEPRRTALFAGELFALFFSFVGGAQLLARLAGYTPDRADLMMQAILGTIALQAGFYFADLYDVRVALEDAPRPHRLLKAIGAATIAVGIATLMMSVGPARASLIAGLGTACTVAIALRAALPDIGRRIPLRRKVFIVGGGVVESALRREIERDGQSEIVGATTSPSGLEARARQSGATDLVVAVDDRRGLDVRDLLNCRLAGFQVTDAASFAERALMKIPVDLTRPSTLVFSDGFDRPSWLLYARRLLSLAASAVLFVLVSPLLALTAVIIRIDSPGPIFYSQERVGLRGATFRMLKFRTMKVDAETNGARWATKDDPRITRVGKFLRRFRIDELPQILNVLLGEMGLVGPRPERPQFVSQLRRQIPYYDLRHLVAPGITGWAQIRYPYAASLEEAREKLQYDLYYVKHLSVILDLVILFHTAKVVIFGRGAR